MNKAQDITSLTMKLPAEEGFSDHNAKRCSAVA